MKERLEKHIAQRENRVTEQKIKDSEQWQFVLWGYLMGSKTGAGIEPEQAIRNFFEGKEIPYQESTIQYLLERWEEFKKSDHYKAHK